MPAPRELPTMPFGAMSADAIAKFVPVATAPLAASGAAAIGAAGASWAMWLGWTTVMMKSGQSMMAYAPIHGAEPIPPVTTPKAESASPAKPVASKAPTKPVDAAPMPTVPKAAAIRAPKPEPVTPSAPAPVVEQSAAVPAKTVTTRPMALDAPKHGKPDDLKLISGIGPKLEIVLNDLGIYHFDQIASWTKTEIDWVDDYLKFSGRIERDDWIAQAKTLTVGGPAE